MAWNEPGNNNDNKDPWGNNKRGGQNQGPPDLDEIFNKLSQKLSGKFGNKGSGNNGSSSGTSNGGGMLGLGLLLAVAIGAWVFSGFYTVAEAERGVVLRLGKFSHIVDPGLNWRPQFIDTVNVVDVQAIRSLRSSGSMLTKDENVVTVEMGVQYRVSNPEKYLYQVTDANDSLHQATDSALRAVIGDSLMDSILTSGRDQIRQATEETLNEIIDKYDMGLTVVDVNFQSSRPPQEVEDAFNDAIAAREDEERFIRLADAHKNEILPQATGEAERLKKEAEGYSQRTINEALGQVAQFEKLLPEYKSAPEVTRTRLYLDSMEKIYSKSSKVLIDSESSGNMIYLPVDKIIDQANAKTSSGKKPVTNTSGQSNSTVTTTGGNQPTQQSTNTRQGRF